MVRLFFYEGSRLRIRGVMAERRIPEELVEYITGEAKNAGYVLVNVSSRGSRSFVIEVALDKEGGITLDECSAFNRKIKSWIEEKDIVGGNVALDVCSPGLDREIKSDREFLWAMGKNVQVRTHERVGDNNVVTGKLLEGSSEKDISVETGEGDTVLIQRENIAKIRLCVTI